MIAQLIKYQFLNIHLQIYIKIKFQSELENRNTYKSLKFTNIKNAHKNGEKIIIKLAPMGVCDNG